MFVDLPSSLPASLPPIYFYNLTLSLALAFSTNTSSYLIVCFSLKSPTNGLQFGSNILAAMCLPALRDEQRTGFAVAPLPE